MLGIIEKVKSMFFSDFVRKIIRREKSIQKHEEIKKEGDSKGQKQVSEGKACD